MSDVPGGYFVVYSITASGNCTEVCLVNGRSACEQPGYVPLSSELVRVIVRNADAEWWKDRLGKRVGLVFQD